MSRAQPGSGRRERLARARLYLVVDASPPGGALPDLLAAAIAGGVEVVQLREKHLADGELLAVAATVRAVCERLGALFVLNDRPDLALACGADGVHVGQEDMPPVQARAQIGGELLLGLSTHKPAEIDAADPAIVDYIGVGPVHATPTKPGRPAVGNELVRYASAHAAVPFFAIGGLDGGNLQETLDAGATRVCVLRAIGDAADARLAARAIAERLSEA